MYVLKDSIDFIDMGRSNIGHLDDDLSDACIQIFPKLILNPWVTNDQSAKAGYSMFTAF